MDQKQHNLTPAQTGNGNNGEPQRPPNGEEPALAPAGRTGIIAWFVSNHVAANLLMLFIIVAGVITLLTMKAEVFQEIELDRINVTVPYPGATPAEVEEGIVQRVEEAIEGIRGIKRIRSIAVEGAGTVTAELEEFADNRKVLSDVEQAVERIINFPPADAEEPIIQELETNDLVIGIVLYGDVPERSLKQLADQMRDELTAMPGISQVGIVGARPYEISIELSEAAMRRHGLTFDQVAERVRRNSLDLPGGSVKTAGGEILLRTKGQRYIGDDFADIVLLDQPDGSKVRLEDVATIRDTFEDVDLERYFDGKLAAEVRISRTGDEHALEVASRVEQYLKERQLPAGIEMSTWNNRASFLRDRISLLLRNGWMGLTLVFLSLALFLDLRLAFWTTMGIPLAFMGGFLAMPLFGVSINMLSLFALIVVLGIVVDDAIVVGENVFAYRQRGMSPMDAAIRGVREMAIPVTLAVLTTIFAFLPLAFTAGQIGKITWPVPVVVSAVLLFSLIEALFILPAHLASGRNKLGTGPIARVQGWVRAGLDWFIDRIYRPSLRVCVSWRYVTLMACMTILLGTMGLVFGGYIKFMFMGGVEGDNVIAKVEMPQGTPVEQTRQVVRHLEQAAMRVREKFDAQYASKDGKSVKHMATTVGEAPALNEGPGAAGGGQNNGAHLGQVNVELLSGEIRTFSADQFRQAWREEAGVIPGVTALTFSSDFFNAGDPIAIELSHKDYDTLLVAAGRLKGELAKFDGVNDIQDSFQPGKREFTFELTPAGRAAGLTLRDVGRQVRQAFYGEEIQRVQRGRDDIKVMLRLPEEDRRTLGSIDELRIRLPDGTAVPLATVANVNEGRGYARINRTDRKRVVTVSADVDEGAADANAINALLGQNVLPQLKLEMPGLDFTFEGEQREQSESLVSLGRGMGLALFAIYGLLAVQFRSYIQPVIVMTAIPFGLVGAALGHLAMGYNLTILSAFGVVALSGVVVNDSLIMIDLINRERAAGVPLRQAILESGARRFRPILLTTATTFLGLMPMILETSIQAKFLIPMAISLGFGVVFATALTLLFVPTLYRILEDVMDLFRREKPAPAKTGTAAEANWQTVGSGQQAS